jgi:adenylate kinase
LNIFIAGIHGVGKSYLASKVAMRLGYIHASASTLIREEKRSDNWSTDKRVRNVDENQVALINAVKKINSRNQRLLIDGHFVLLNSSGEFEPLNHSVFSQLSLSGVILIETYPSEVARRIEARDNVKNDLLFLEEFMQIERAQAFRICEKLNIGIELLEAPTIEQFQIAVTKFREQYN